MATTDYYKTLGVSRSASEREIKQAYRRLARKFHPDVNRDNLDAEARFKEINAAYEVISDADSRRKYDQYGDRWQHADQIEQMRRQESSGFPSGFGAGTAQGGFQDALGRFFSGGGNQGGAFAGGRRAQNVSPDIEAAAEISLEEAFGGAKRSVTIPGPGHTRQLEVDIPAGVDTGSRVRITGAGRSGGAGRPPGDLYLTITVRPHPLFKRTGADLRVDIPVPLYDALLGGEVKVTTILGRSLVLRIPPETPNGASFRLAGQGMPRAAREPQGSVDRGDLYVNVQVELPVGLGDHERVLLEELRSLHGSTGEEGG